MKLTKKLEAEVLKAYNTMWKAYLNGDIKTFASYLHKDFKVIGTAEKEVFSSKKKAVKFYTDTAEQITGLVQMRNRNIKLMPVESNVLITEYCDAYVLIDKKWTFYGPIRLTTLLTKDSGKWQNLNQHGSLPDSKTDEGEQLAIKKIEKENLQLKEAVNRRTVELQQKNHELEIETALEKVRAVAMGMKHPADMLHICKTIAIQMQSLGINKIRNVQTAIFYDDRETYVNYEYYAKHDKTIITETSYTNHKIHIDFAAQMLKGKGEFFTTEIKGKKKLEAWIAYQKTTNVFIDPFIKTAKSLTYYWHSLGPVALGTSTYEPLTDNEKNVFKRFLNVFELSYRRYLDIEKAEAQAREAKIETALEKVRSHSLAMHKSDELKDVVAVVFEKLKDLGLTFDVAGIQLFTDGSKDIVQWVAAPGLVSAPILAKLPYSEKDFLASAIIRDVWMAKEKGKSFHNNIYSFEEKNKFFEYAARHNDLDTIPADVREFQMLAPSYTQTLVAEKHSALWVDSYKGQTISTYESNILGRFARVFEQAYVRFLDLQKAEEQAREAQIEAALERVRSRAMAMQTSKDLNALISHLFNECTRLDIVLDRCLVMIVDPKTLDTIWVLSNPETPEEPSNHLVKYHEYHPYLAYIDAWKKRVEKWHYILEGTEKKEWDQFIFQQTELSKLPSPVKEGMQAIKSIRLNCSFGNFGSITLSSYVPLTEPQEDILTRFTKVFDLTYTRFNDLKQAEAQAREAQIQLALERVRARTMAMQKSAELREVTVVVYNQLKNLGFINGAASITIMDSSSGNMDWWMEGSKDGFNFLKGYHVNYFDHKSHNEQLAHWKNGDSYAAIIVSGNDKKEFDEYYFNKTDFIHVPEETKKMMIQQDTVIFSMAYMLYGALSWSPQPLNSEFAGILQRFAKVFEQTYTRFLDLQKAEAQAREAQIEAALERVRSRSMGMHKSDDLHEVIKIVTEQLAGLGLKFNVANFAKVYTEGSWDLWVSSPEQSYPALIHVPNLDHPIFNHVREITAKGIDFFTHVYTREEKDTFFRHFFENSEARYAPEERKQFVYNTNGFSRSLFLAKNIWFSVSLYDTIPFTAEENAIFKRFANVFEQAYTRFLDLQKAEAQSREVQIQLALERVRARTMAMHKSDELQEVIQVLSQQFLTLGFKIGAATFALNYRDSNDFNLWLSVPDANYITRVHVPYFDHSLFHNFIEAKEKGLNFIVQQLSFEEKNSYFRHFFANVPGSSEEEMKAVYNSKGYAGSEVLMQSISLGIANLDGIPYTEEENVILKRFASAFEQSYIRFTDLQKAEAQVREAEIELALERVRARTMAMHHSSELSEAATLVFEQLNQLGAVLWSCGFTICKSDSDIVERWMSQPNGKMLEPMQIPLYSSWGEQVMYDAWKNQTELFTYVAEGKELAEGFENLKSHPSTQIIYQRLMEIGIPFPTWMKHFVVPFKQGYLWIMALKPFEETQIFIRFTRVFEQTYTRFLDLQKAEAQAREAQIEAALERVRSKAMAMHKSDDLNMAATTVFEELDKLNLGMLRCGIGIVNKEKKTAEVWTATKSDEGTIVQVAGDESMDIHPLLQGAFESWLKQEEFSYELRDEDLINYYRALDDTNFNLPPDVQTITDNKDGLVQYFFTINFGAGGLFSFRTTPYPEESKKVLRRFAGVFNLTYKRFQDIQKAEAQAREAQIEAALEKIRSRSLAMHRSDELKEVITVMFEKLNELKVTLGTVAIWLFDKQSMNSIFWVANNVQQPDKVNLPYDEQLMKEDTNYRDSWQAWLTGKDYVNKEYNREQKNKYFEYVFAHNNLETIPPPAREFILNGEKFIASLIVEKNSALFFDCWSGQVYDEARINVFQRAAKVFEQAYIRFLDLQKAEAQAREGQIEAALERVRSRSMAMHKSDELREVVSVLYEQLQQLNFAEGAATITIMHATGDMDWWMSGFGNSKYPESYHVKNFDHPFHHAQLTAWKKGETFAAIDVEGALKKTYDEIMFHQTDFRKLPEETKLIMTSLPKVTFSLAFIKYGALSWGPLPTGREQSLILQRFAKVFEQSYTRFLDLQKAEAQAKEAQIEAALERVRSKAMAMHNSSDLSAAASLVFTELRKLGINPIRCGVGVLNKESRKGQLYSATSSEASDSLSLIGWVMLEGHPVMENIYDSWVNQYEYYPELSGEELRSYYGNLLSGLSVPVSQFKDDEKQYGHFLPFSSGCLYAWSNHHYNDEELKILKRFAAIIDLTFRRYLDLQKTEASAKEAIKQAALDRVRADIASMRTINDLDRITPLIWNELNVLGIPFVRCGVFIMDDAQQQVHTFLSTPDGKAIAAFHLPYTTPGGFSDIVTHWQQKKIYVTHWDQEDYLNLADILLREGAVKTKEQYISQMPPEGIYLHFLPFMQGMLYAGNIAKLNDDQVTLIQSVADAFSTAYARYEDFNKLEAAKQQVEKTLVDLKQTQQQLVQSEKMASLGELTAGIAHEIQNPLNFVNNFSEVNTELIAEMISEVKKGNIEDAEMIANDIKLNLEKINHHGKRADGIVKGMLQHSRRNSGEKELTDINVLADEYLRLAYHGLRAKDKSFNATLKTDFDNTIEKIQIIPQDIGRVILNLVNNAFYTVNEKKKIIKDIYEPTVSISTEKASNKILITIKDNGNGIPQTIVDKIFQPFFTTKPTGSGTGLGLSLAYDIVKVHGGEIKVETKEGEGTTFTIQLPI